MSQDDGLHLTRQEARILAMVLAECVDKGFGEPDFWLTEAAYRDYRWLRDVMAQWCYEHPARDDTPAPP